MREKSINILIIEDDALTMQITRKMLSPYGKIYCARTDIEANKILNSGNIDLAFFDLNLNGELTGINLLNLARINKIYSIVLSGESSPDTLERAYKNGAMDYLAKPFSQEKLTAVMTRFFNNQKHIEFEALINSSFITKSPSLTEELYKIKNLSISDKPVLIQGETGTGKRVIAHLIKKIFKTNNFLEINCAQFSDEIFSSELFGHKKGSFTGADSDKIGILEKAHDGIVFLDEIHGLSIKSQKALLKAIEEKEFYPVGSTKLVKSNFRVICASCDDIRGMIDQGTFRQDLFARINTFSINIPPLRDRREDVPLLFEHFIAQQLIQVVISKEAKTILESYSWPENTREIKDLVENWIVHGKRLIASEDLPVHIRNNITKTSKIVSDEHLDLVEEHGLKQFLLLYKKEIIEQMTKRYGGRITNASKPLDVATSNLSNFLKTHKDCSLIQRGSK
jgi:two-component system response regulator AtoC